MLVILDTQKHSSQTVRQKMKSFFCPYEIRVTLKSQNGISVLSVQYHYYRGNINFKNIVPMIRGCSESILCDESLPLENTSLKRFHSEDFYAKMMQNFIISVLEHSNISPDKLNIGYFDPKAEYSDFAKQLLKYTSRLVVVSDMPKFYENLSERLMKQSGISFIVNNCPETLYDCDILICPAVVERPIRLKNNAVLFTVKNPSVPPNGTVIHLYDIPFPRFFRELKPENLDESYFLSALYAVYHIKQLDKIVPVSCSNGKDSYSREEMIQLFHSFCS